MLNLSGRPLPRTALNSEERTALGGIKSAADAIRILDLPCIVAEPKASLYLSNSYRNRDTSIRDTSARIGAVIARDETDERAAKARAERLTRALRAGPDPVAGLATQGQIATTLRSILLLAISAESGVRPEAQVWIRSDARLQTAIEALFSAPRGSRSSDFSPAIPAIVYLLNRRTERSEDAFRALERFIAKYLS